MSLPDYLTMSLLIIQPPKTFFSRIAWSRCLGSLGLFLRSSLLVILRFIAFAHDSILGTTDRTDSNLRSKLILLFERAIQWFVVNYLALNVGKSCFLIFSRVSKACPDINEI